LTSEGYTPTIYMARLWFYARRRSLRLAFLFAMSSPLARAIYQTKRWTRASKAARERDGYRCCMCGASANTAHHRPPLEELLAAGLDPYDKTYIFTLCHHCHGVEDGGRAHPPKPAKKNRFAAWL
jgi:5-methylcytosine-specific restriction endonuclease McrA